jgi:hypothetical protein
MALWAQLDSTQRPKRLIPAEVEGWQITQLTIETHLLIDSTKTANPEYPRPSH